MYRNCISLAKPDMYSSLIYTDSASMYSYDTSGRTDLMERGGSLKLHQIGLKVLASKIVEDLVELHVWGHVLEEQRRQLIERHHLHQVAHVTRYRCTTRTIISLRLKCVIIYVYKYNRLY